MLAQEKGQSEAEKATNDKPGIGQSAKAMAQKAIDASSDAISQSYDGVKAGIQESFENFEAPAIPDDVKETIEDFKEKKDLVSNRAEIFCEKASHKGIIIGKNGETIKKIGTYAREELEEFLGCRVCIDLWVKVKKNWRDSVAAAKNFVYGDN